MQLSTKILALTLVAVAVASPIAAPTDLEARQFTIPICPREHPLVVACHKPKYEECLKTGYPCVPPFPLPLEVCQNYCEVTSYNRCGLACRPPLPARDCPIDDLFFWCVHFWALRCQENSLSECRNNNYTPEQCFDYCYDSWNNQENGYCCSYCHMPELWDDLPELP